MEEMKTMKGMPTAADLKGSTGTVQEALVWKAIFTARASGQQYAVLGFVLTLEFAEKLANNGMDIEYHLTQQNDVYDYTELSWVKAEHNQKGSIVFIDDSVDFVEDFIEEV